MQKERKKIVNPKRNNDLSERKKIVISLGGSLIFPSQELDQFFLKSFHDLVVRHVKKYRFFIVTGGGKIARHYQKVADGINKLKRDDLDWLGIHSSRLNAHLIRTIFRHNAHPKVINNPEEKESVKDSEQIIVAAGFRPGRSTDWIGVELARNYGINEFINLTNTDYVYDKDPQQFADAKKFDSLSWHDLLKITGLKWDPGKNVPFDPVAAKLAEKINLKVVIMNGKNLANLENYLQGEKDFVGTTVSLDKSKGRQKAKLFGGHRSDHDPRGKTRWYRLDIDHLLNQPQTSVIFDLIASDSPQERTTVTTTDTEAAVATIFDTAFYQKEFEDAFFRVEQVADSKSRPRDRYVWIDGSSHLPTPFRLRDPTPTLTIQI